MIDRVLESDWDLLVRERVVGYQVAGLQLNQSLSVLGYKALDCSVKNLRVIVSSWSTEQNWCVVISTGNDYMVGEDHIKGNSLELLVQIMT